MTHATGSDVRTQTNPYPPRCAERQSNKPGRTPATQNGLGSPARHERRTTKANKVRWRLAKVASSVQILARLPRFPLANTPQTAAVHGPRAEDMRPAALRIDVLWLQGIALSTQHSADA